MPRYFVQRRRPRADWDDDDWPEPPLNHIPIVCDHEAVDTGLVNENGDPIMRAPNPMGFIW